MQSRIGNIRTAGTARHGGFSLIEILVVISIIALLIGMALYALMGLRDQGQASRSEAVLRGAGGLLTEYQFHANGWPEYPNSEYPNGYSGVEDDASIRAFVKQVRGVGRVNEMLEDMDDAYARDDDGDGRVDVLFDGFNPDLPLRYARENAAQGGGPKLYGAPDAGLPMQRLPYLAAAGEDRLWGRIDPETNEPDPSADENGDGLPDAQDNVYSFELR